MRIRGGLAPGQSRIGASEIPISSVGVPEKEISETPTSSSYSEQLSSFSGEFTTRCEGLDLLAMAVEHVVGNVLVGSPTGSVFWVSVVQRKVIRRAKRALWLQKAREIRDMAAKEEEKKKGIALQEEMVVLKKKRRSSLRYMESAAQPCKRLTRVQPFVHRPDSGLGQPLD